MKTIFFIKHLNLFILSLLLAYVVGEKSDAFGGALSFYIVSICLLTCLVYVFEYFYKRI